MSKFQRSHSIFFYVCRVFMTPENCAEGGSGPSFSWMSTDYCGASTGSDGSAQSTKYTSCDGKTITYTQFSDSTCTTPLRTESFPLTTCMATDGNVEYVTRECTSDK